MIQPAMNQSFLENIVRHIKVQGQVPVTRQVAPARLIQKQVVAFDDHPSMSSPNDCACSEHLVLDPVKDGYCHLVLAGQLPEQI